MGNTPTKHPKKNITNHPLETMATTAKKEQVCLRLLIDEKKNKVLFAEAGKDFVDVLLSFLTLPLGTIARLVGKTDESNMKKIGVGVGSLSSLYESVTNLDENQFWTATCKEMLLRPRNSMEGYCQNIKLNIDDTEKTKYFICENWDCSRNPSGGLLSTFKNQRCKCGKLMNREIKHQRTSPSNNNHQRTSPSNKGFVPQIATFIISDDLKVKPHNFQNSVSHMIVEYEDFDAVSVTVNVTQKEIVDLLRCSLLSTTPLTDTFLRKKRFVVNAQPVWDFNLGYAEANGGGKTMKVKVMLRKSNNTILYALCEEDFADFILSFLTFPLVGVENMLNGKCCLGSIDNLYRSLLDLDPCKYMTSPELKDKFVKSQVAHLFKLRNQILPVDEVPTPNYSCYTNYYSWHLTALKNYTGPNHQGEVIAPLSYLEPQSSNGEAYNSCGGRGFLKSSSSVYMVTDDLIITPSSPVSTVLFLANLRISPSDLEEITMDIGKKEGLSLLRASLISSSALTNGLSPFLKPVTVKKEKYPN